MTYIDQHLQPGEIILDRIQRSRKWSDVLLSFIVDALAVLAVLYMFDQVQRLFVEGYIRSSVSFGGGKFMVINLFLGILPFALILALVLDFVFTFFVELALTDRRVFGRISGLAWLKEISIGLDEVEELAPRFGYLMLRARGSRIYLSGFYNTRHFLETFRRTAPRRGMTAARFDVITDPVSVGK